MNFLLKGKIRPNLDFHSQMKLASFQKVRIMSNSKVVPAVIAIFKSFLELNDQEMKSIQNSQLAKKSYCT